MKELEEKLNSNPCSINMHDGCLLCIKFDEKRLILKFMMEQYTYRINSKIFGDYVKDYPILYEIFEDVNIVDFSFDSSFDFLCSEIMGNEQNGDVYKLTLLDNCRNFACISFKYKSFKWLVGKEVTKDEQDRIYDLAYKRDLDNPIFQIKI